MKKILITGGAGFIGSHVVRRFVNNYPEYQIFNLDALTYAGNLENLKDIENWIKDTEKYLSEKDAFSYRKMEIEKIWTKLKN